MLGESMGLTAHQHGRGRILAMLGRDFGRDFVVPHQLLLVHGVVGGRVEARDDACEHAHVHPLARPIVVGLLGLVRSEEVRSRRELEKRKG